MKTVDAALGKWPGIIRHMGIDERYLSGKHSECPLCGQGKDTFRFDDKNGSGSYYCGKCGSGYGMNFAMKLLGVDFREAAKRVDEILGEGQIVTKEQKPKKEPKILLHSIATGAKPLDGSDPASVYLGNRGLSVTSSEIRWNPSLTYWGKDDAGRPIQLGRFSAMLAPVCGENGEALTYHVTYLDQGQKAEVPCPKKLMTPIKPITGGAIRLFPASEQLAVAEGIETALAFYEAYKIPVWATCTAGMMESLVVPPEVKELTIVADNDASFTGQKAAYTLANKFSLAGGFAEVILEGEQGQDFLDVFTDNKQAEGGANDQDK